MICGVVFLSDMLLLHYCFPCRQLWSRKMVLLKVAELQTAT